MWVLHGAAECCGRSFDLRSLSLCTSRLPWIQQNSPRPLHFLFHVWQLMPHTMEPSFHLLNNVERSWSKDFIWIHQPIIPSSNLRHSDGGILWPREASKSYSVIWAMVLLPFLCSNTQLSPNVCSWCILSVPLLQYLPKHLHIVCVDMPGHEGTTRTNTDDYSIQGQARRIHQVNLRERGITTVIYVSKSLLLKS